MEMAFLKNKIILLFCLFLYFEKAHFQFDDEDGQDDFPQRYSRESSKRKKYETSWRSEDDQDQEQMQAQDPEQDPDEQLWPRDHRECPTSICSAENANALRFEKPKKLGSANRFNKQKDDKDVHNMGLKCDEDDDDDGDDGDDDDEDDDDDDEADDDEYLSDGEQEAFLARMRCLMKSLDTHTRAIHRNLKTLQSRINKAKERSSTCRKPDFYTHPKDKWFENPQQEEKENHPEQCVPEATKKVNNRQDTPVYTLHSPHSPQRLQNLQDSQRSESPQGSQSPQRSDYIQDSESSQNLATPQQSQRQQESQRPQGLQDSQSPGSPESSQGAPGPQSPQSPPSNSDNNLKVSPLLKLLNNPAALQSKPDSPGYWVPNPVLTRPEDISVHFNKRSNPRYEEYEARLRRLMANRDAIERNVMKVMGSSRKIPRK